MKKEINGNNEWKKTNSGVRRDQTFPSGMQRTELVNPLFGRKSVFDKFPGATRNHYMATSTKVEGVYAGFQDGLLRSVRSEIEIEDEQGEALLYIRILENNDISISFRNKRADRSSQLEEDNLVSVIYNNSDGTLKGYRLQAEPPSYKKESALPWKEGITILLNLIKTATSEDLIVAQDASITLFNSTLNRHSQEARDRLSPQIDILKIFFITQVLNALPFEERKDSLRLLEAAGIDYVMQGFFLDDFDHKAKNVSPDAFLDFLINSEIDILSKDKDSQRVIKVVPTSAETFSWQEVDIEKDDVEETEDIKEEIDYAYGDSINSQGNEFRIIKDNNSIIVTCQTRSKKSWVVNLLLTLPVKEISTIITDLNPEHDFRRVKDLVPASFKKQN